MDRPNLQLPVLEQLRKTQTLWSRESEVDPAGHASFKKLQVFRTRNARDEQVKIVNVGGVECGQRNREEAGLLLVVAFEHNAITPLQSAFEDCSYVFCPRDLALQLSGNGVETALLVGTTSHPDCAFCMDVVVNSRWYAIKFLRSSHSCG